MKKMHVAIASVLVAIIVIGSIYTAIVVLDLYGTPDPIDDPILPIEPEPIGYGTYSKYGFSFKYPKGIVIEESGEKDQYGNYESGIVTAQNMTYPSLEKLGVVWVPSKTAPSAQTIEDWAAIIPDMGDDVSLLTGNIYESTKSGHKLTYRLLTFTTDVGDYSLNSYEIIGIWYCDTESTIYSFTYRHSEALVVYGNFMQHLEWFVCH